MQIRVKFFVLNENAAKHLHLDPCRKITQWKLAIQINEMPKEYFKLYPSRANIWESLKHILQYQEKKTGNKQRCQTMQITSR